MNREESNTRFEANLGRAIIAIKVLDTLGLTVSSVNLGADRPQIGVVHPHDRVHVGAVIENCEITWSHDDDELPPCVGERMRDVLHDILRNGVDA